MKLPIQRRGGFTLIEVLMAVFLGGLILAAGMGFLLSLSGIWAQRTADRMIESHLLGISRALGVWIEEGKANGTLRLDEATDFGLSSEPLLQWEIQRSSVFFQSENHPGTAAGVWLQVDQDDSLWLVWRSNLLEWRGPQDYLRRRLTPLPAELYFRYRNEGIGLEWRREDRPLREGDGTYPLPDLLELVIETERGPRTLLFPLTRVAGIEGNGTQPSAPRNILF